MTYVLLNRHKHYQFPETTNPKTEFNLLPRTLRGRRHVQFDSTSTQFLSLREKRGKHRIPKDIVSLGGRLVACLPSGFSGRSMKRQSHLIAVVSQFKKKKTVRKLAKFVRGEDLRTKPSYEGARSLLTTLTCLCSITSNLTAQKSH